MSLVVHTMPLSRNMDIGMLPLIWVDMKDISVRALRSYRQKKLKSNLPLWVIQLWNIPIKRSHINLPTTCLVDPTVCQMDLGTVMRLFKIQLEILYFLENQALKTLLSGTKAYVHNSWKPPYWGVFYTPLFYGFISKIEYRPKRYLKIASSASLTFSKVSIFLGIASKLSKPSSR